MLHFCRICDDRFDKLQPYLHHLKSHRHITASFPCGLENCKKIYPAEGSLRSHLLRSHRLNIRYAADQGRSLLPLNAQCRLMCTIPTCAAQFDAYRGLSKHLAGHILSGRAVACPFPNCRKVYNVVGSLSGHISKYHKVSALSGVGTDLNNTASDQGDAHYADEHYTDEHSNDVTAHVPAAAQVTLQEWQKSLAEFFLRLEFKYLIPARTVQYIMKEMHHVQNEAIQVLLDEVKGLCPSERGRKESFDTTLSRFEAAFSKLRSSHCRFNFYKEHFLFVEPKKVPLRRMGIFFYYVSIKRTLQKMMMSKSAHLIHLTKPRVSGRGILRDFYDGSVYQQNPFFRSHDKAFRIILFQDGFELVNPLGSAKRKYKLLGVYMSLGNLPDYIRTHPDSMQLVALCKEKELVHADVFGRIAEELKEIENDGVEIAGHGRVRGSLLYVAGDNLGSHGVGGFVENFNSSRYFCRYCLVDRPTFLSVDGHNLTYQPRNKDNYEAALQGRNIDGRKGVKFNSKLNELTNFHVCNPGLPPCLGHDILEGIASYDVALILHHLVDEDMFTYDQLNEEIESFPYSTRDRREKPVPFIESYEKMKGKMWQLYNSIRLFPIMLCQYITDVEDSAWRMLILLGEILDILCSPTMHKAWLGHLQGLIWEYLNLRVKTFAETPLRPKHHYMTHYCDMIVLFGPLGKVWTLRFESKHQFFKNTLRSTRNFINVMYSCSNRHEMWQAYLRAGGDMRCLSVTSKSVEFQSTLYCDEILRAVRRESTLCHLRECTKAEIKGTVYTKGNILVLWQTQYEYQVSFGRLLLILYTDEDNLLFLVEVLSSEFVPQSRAYKLGGQERFHCIRHSDLPCYYPLHAYKYQGNLWVKLKHALVSHASGEISALVREV